MDIGLKILIISQKSDFCMYCEDIFTASGFQTRSTSLISEVFQLTEIFRPDIILFDLQFASPDASAFVRTIKSNPDFQNSLIVLVCDKNSEMQDIENAIQAGADDFLVKPFSDKMLIARINLISKIHIARWKNRLLEEANFARNIFLQESTNILSRISKSPNLYQNNLTEFLHEITESVAEFLNVDRVSVWLFDENKAKITCNDLYIKPKLQHLKGDEILADDYPVYFETIKKARILAAPDAIHDRLTMEFAESYLQNTGIVSMLDSPILHKGQVSGIICIEAIGQRRDWNPDEMNFSASISDFLSLALQINERKMLEMKAQESDKLKTAFIANLSHKLRTPLNSISGFINLFPDKSLSENEREHYIRIININIQKLLQLMNDVIDISKIQTGQIHLIFKSIDLHEFFEEIKQLSDELLQLYNKPNLQLRISLPPFDFQIETDPSRLKQIFGYLIDNAIKFTAQGLVEIGYQVDSFQLVSFYVKDTGPGISAEQARNIFIPFSQFNQYFSQTNEGPGLGLVLSNGLVTLMQGTMWVESEYGAGATFWFKLPVSQNQELAKAINVYPESDDKDLNWTGKKILIVEDVLNNYELLEKMLHKTGATFFWADTGELALQLFKMHTDLDLVLMDIKLPDIDGLELTRQMKKERPRLPIVAQTAFAMSGDREKVLESGCDEYLPKPISRIKLLRVLSEFIK